MDKLYVRLASPLQEDSIVDGEGIRTVIWFQGCAHNCECCHNPSSHDFNAGELVDVEEIKKKLEKLEFQKGITFSGGDPLYQPEALFELAKYTHKLGMDVWCYTGFTFEELLSMARRNKVIKDVLSEIDILVDGKFELEKKCFEVKFRGSYNQRILDVKESLKENKAVEIEKYIYKVKN